MIDIEHINSVAPYKLYRSSNPMFYEFKTDYGVRYSVGFMEDDGLLSVEAYHFVIANVNNLASPSDEKVRDTIMFVLDSFFILHNTIMLYICETGDGKQAMRSRLFNHWFSMFDKKREFTCMSASVIDEDGEVNYATLISRNDNPNLAKALSDFSETVAAMNSKPDSLPTSC